MVFKSMFSHGYVPSKLMVIVNSPIIKDKKSLVTDTYNYTPIAGISVTSNVIELILLESLANELGTAHLVAQVQIFTHRL